MQIPPSTKDQPAPAAERVLAGARAHFLRHGLRGVTMDDLAVELGMSKKTLYAHFPSKTALLAAVVENKFHHIQTDLQALSGQLADAPFAARLQALIACVRGHTEELQPAFLRDARAEEPALFAALQERRRELIHRFFGQLMKEGARAGAVRRDVPLRLLIEILIGAVEAVVPARLEELELTTKQTFSHIISVFLEGALVRPGGKRGGKGKR